MIGTVFLGRCPRLGYPAPPGLKNWLSVTASYPPGSRRGTAMRRPPFPSRLLTLGLMLAIPWATLSAGERPATAPELAAQGKAQMKAGRWAKAVTLLEKAVELNPVNGHYWER